MQSQLQLAQVIGPQLDHDILLYLELVQDMVYQQQRIEEFDMTFEGEGVIILRLQFIL